jgi:hypothetical protein
MKRPRRNDQADGNPDVSRDLVTTAKGNKWYNKQ